MSTEQTNETVASLAVSLDGYIAEADGGVAFLEKSGPTGAAIRGFAERTPTRLWVFGGGRVITDALVAGAVDTLDMTVMPEALGAGIPLFASVVAPGLEVVDITPYANGAVRTVYDVTSARGA